MKGVVSEHTLSPRKQLWCLPARGSDLTRQGVDGCFAGDVSKAVRAGIDRRTTGHPEISELGSPAVVDDNIVGFNVTMKQVTYISYDHHADIIYHISYINDLESRVNNPYVYRY